jgi:3D (Asp-Asp-Asp) domain-containing protein
VLENFRLHGEESLTRGTARFKMRRNRPMRKRPCFVLLTALLLNTGCAFRDLRWQPIRPPHGATYRVVVLEATGYCACGDCCNWRRTWLGRTVIARGPSRGHPKKVGYTASGVQAHPGTIAADTSLFPFGTIMYVPGYGYGRVEDRGGDIQGARIDLFFLSHQTALNWGRTRTKVRVWPAGSR